MTSQCYNRSQVESRNEGLKEGGDVQQDPGLGQTKVSIFNLEDSMEQGVFETALGFNK